MASVLYATLEEVKSALDVKATARSDAKILRILESSSRQAEAILHRRFYPEIATRAFPWPNSVRDYGTLWLDDSELISATSVVTSGVTLAASAYNLEPNTFGPPFNRIEVVRSGTATYGGGYGQRDIVITGTFCGCAIDETAGAALASSALAADTTITVGAGSIGVGALLRIDSERMIVTGKAQVTTGQTITANLLAAQNGTLVPVVDGTQISAGETILVDAEYMRVVDVAGNNLIVQRAWDGSVLAAHTSGATVYAPRRLTVARGVLGTTAASHASSASVLRFNFPAPVKVFTIALTLDTVEQESATYARTTGSGNSIRDTGGRGLEIARRNAVTACGRFNRTAVI